MDPWQAAAEVYSIDALVLWHEAGGIPGQPAPGECEEERHCETVTVRRDIVIYVHDAQWQRPF